MYAVPVKVNVPAKDLIKSFERGEILVTREEDENEVEKPVHPEMSVKELAQPGTARKRMLELERLRKEAEAREKPTTSTRKLSVEMYGEFAQDRKKGGGSEFRRASEGQKNSAEILRVEHMRVGPPIAEHPIVEHHEVEHHVVEHHRVEHPVVEHDAVDHHRVEHPIVEHDVVEHHRAEHPIVEHHTVEHSRVEVSVGEQHKVSHETVRGGKTGVLVVTASTGSGADVVLDKGLVDSVVRIFKDDDHEVHVTDLNHIKGHPIDYSLERNRLKAAQLIVFHFRPILHNVPAALMDWFQHVLIEDFAFDRRNGKTFDEGLLKGKRSLLLVTLSEEKSSFDGNSLLGDFSQYLWPIQNGVLRYSGLSVLSPHVIYAAHEESHDDTTQTLAGRLRNVWHETTLFHGHN